MAQRHCYNRFQCNRSALYWSCLNARVNNIPFHNRVALAGIGVTYKFNNTRTLFAGLDSLQDSRDGPGATFFGLVRVTKLIPYDSAIFVCTDRAPYDPNVGKHAAMTLLKKRIRVSEMGGWDWR